MTPAPGQSHLVNLVATLRANHNTPANLNLARIARHQPSEITEGDLVAEFERQERPPLIVNAFEEPEGK